jgi:hypothetical protein
MRWNSTNPRLAIHISTNFSEDETDAILSAMEEWEVATNSNQLFENDFGAETITYRTIASQDNKSLDNHINDSIFGIFKPTSWFSDVSNGALAITQYTGITRSFNGVQYLELLHADIMMNPNYDFSLNPGVDDYDFETVVLHEFGHLLGLGHTALFIDSVMNATLGTGVRKRSLRSADEENINHNYDLSSPLWNPSSSTSSALVAPSSTPDGTIVRGVFHQMAEGKCHHYLDGKLIYTHDR